jgi:uncharacterized protein (TIGR03118 family)
MLSQSRSIRALAFLAVFAFTVVLVSREASAQYQVVKLVSNQAGKAKHQDASLVNAWGLSFFPGNPIWVSDNGTGKSSFYDSKGVKAGEITIPPASGTGAGSPAGQIANTTNDFKIGGSAAIFIFGTTDGTISGWTGNASAVIAVTAHNATFFLLALAQSQGANFLYAADCANNKVDIYDGTYKLVGSFTDTTLKGFAPYGIQNIGGKLFVAFTNASFSAGVVDIYNPATGKIRLFSKDAHLVAPWGLALAPKNFGPASNDILVGNLGNGRINAFNPKNGKFIGALKNKSNKPLLIDGLWGLAFGGGGTSGKKNQLFFTAGPSFYADGLFGVINP